MKREVLNGQREGKILGYLDSSTMILCQVFFFKWQLKKKCLL